MNFYDTIRYNLYVQFVFLISPFYYSKRRNQFVVPKYLFVTVLLFSVVYLSITKYLFQSVTLRTSREIAAASANLSQRVDADLANIESNIVRLLNSDNFTITILENPLVEKKQKNALIVFIGNLEIFMTIGSFILFTINSYYYKYEHIQFLEMVNNFDEECLKFTNDKEALHYKSSIQLSLLRIIFIIFYYFILQSFIFMQMFYSDNILNTVAFLICYAYAAGLNGFNSLTYTAYILILFQRFTIIKHSLKRFMASDGQHDSKSRLKKLYKIFKRYKTLASGIDMMNRCFGLPCLLVILHDFTITTSQIYMIFSTLTDGNTNKKYTVVLAICVWMFPNVVKMSSITLFCHITINSVKRIEELFRWANHHSLKNNDYKYTDEMNKLIEHFSYRKLHYQYKFTANKFVSINATLMFTIVSAITTYLVILIQFKKYEDGNI